METKTLAITLVIVAVLGLMIFFITGKNKSSNMEPTPVGTDSAINTETTIPATTPAPVTPPSPTFPETGYQPK